VGGLVSPGIIKSLKKKTAENNERFFVVGIDMLKDAIGFNFVDKSYVVPKGDSKNYIPRLMEIAEKNNIDVIIPCSDEELLSISKEKDKIMRKGLKAICSDFDIVYKSNDKGLMMEYLKDKDIEVPKFFLPKSIEEIKEAAEELNYPDNSFVVKPRLARGGRGFRVVKEKIDFLCDRNENIKLEHLIDFLGEYKTFPSIILMEYLPGEEYSVDALAYKGEPLHIVPRKRIKAFGGPSVVGEIIENDEVRDMVEKIIRAFGFHLNVNIQLKYSKEGVPLVSEINPRVSGTIVANDAAGINLLYYGIKLTMNQKIPRNIQIKNVKMLRYFEELYIYE
jgi:carbamoyl-phosphate synthase large subunit